jgi:hypothetical protein
MEAFFLLPQLNGIIGGKYGELSRGSHSGFAGREEESSGA